MLGLLTTENNIKRESGNALIYVLIAVVLFGALSFALSRQMDSGETATLSDEKADLYATQLINYVAQAKGSVDQMLFSGSKISDLVFTLPGTATFETGSPIHKVYHPGGGGLIPGVLPPEVVYDSISELWPPGWYMGRFNNVEWSPSTDDDVILVAYKIAESVCESINLKLTGSMSIPTIVTSSALYEVFVDPAIHNSGVPTDFLEASCASCKGKPSLCVTYNGDFAFYSIIATQ